MKGKQAIIGMGNPLMGDDGVGVHLVEMLRAQRESDAWVPRPEVELVAAGADALLAGAVLAECSQALLVDAAEMGGPPGTFRFFAPGEARITGEGGLSAHTLPMAQVLEMVQALGGSCRLRIMGIQCGQTAAGSGLSSAVSLRVPEMLERIKEEVSLQP